MSQLDPLRTFTELTVGKRVDRAAASCGGIATHVLFNIEGGRVLIRNIVGEITVGASGATNMQLQSTPDTGTAAVLDAVLGVNGLEVGTLLSITGAVADAMYGVSAGAAQSMTRDLILPAGAIELTSSAAHTVTIKWSVFYVPLDDGAYIEAA
jgi:hypothetical protein